VDSTLPKPKLPKAVKKNPRFFKLAGVGRIVASVDGTHRCLDWLLADRSFEPVIFQGFAFKT
jgi:hypothetical protein